MAVTSAQVVVSTTAVALTGAADAGFSGGRIVVRNTATPAADVLALGPVGVTAANGFRLPAGATIDLAVPAGEQLYAIRGAAADITADVLRFD